MRQFIIDDSERDRILNLHESATKRQYLKEETNCVTSVVNDVEGIRKYLPRELTTIKSLSGKEYQVTEEIEVCFGQGGEIFTYENNPSKGFKNFKIDLDGDKLTAISTGGA